MAVGQQVLSGDAGLPALQRAAEAVERPERDRRALHGRALRAALDLHAAQCANGMGLGTVAQLALSLDCSELRAGQLLAEAQVLGLLPDALEALDSGLLGVEQAGAFVSATAVLSDHHRSLVWDQLLSRLHATGSPSPARLREWLARAVRTTDPEGAAARRRAAEAGGDISARRRDDGLTDLFATGLSPTNAAACRARIDAASAPWGVDDDRTAGKRRLDAFVDLLLGRDPLAPDGAQDRHCRPACRCHLQSPAPCGVDVQVHVPIGAALGTTGELAALVGHGPLDAGQLHDVLTNAPRLRAVWVDEQGVPVALGKQTLVPDRGDPASLRGSLLRLAASGPPGRLHPRHPHDHPPPEPSSPLAGEGLDPGTAQPHGTALPDGNAPPDESPDPAEPARPLAATTAPGAHPRGTAGPYRVPAALRRLVTTRSPRCEWPGCGHRAVRCDIDHDLAWPEGPTCSCNLGPACRRHHRVKQTGWTKARRSTGVSWTSPTGRHHDSPGPWSPPQRGGHLPPVPRPARHLSPTELEDVRWGEEPPDDPGAADLRISSHRDECLAGGAAPT